MLSIYAFLEIIFIKLNVRLDIPIHVIFIDFGYSYSLYGDLFLGVCESVSFI